MSKPLQNPIILPDSVPADVVALESDAGESVSYGDLLGLVGKVRSSLPRRSLALIFCENTIGCVALTVAMIEAGIVPILIDSRAAENATSEIIARYQPQVIVASLDKFNPDHDVSLRFLDVGARVVPSSSKVRLHEDLALLLTTSGSTGSPKLVRISYQNLRANIRSVLAYLPILESDCCVTSLPIAYTYGLSNVLIHLHVGARVWVTEHSVAERNFWNVFEVKGVTMLGGVPYTYQLLKRVGMMRRPLPSLRVLTQAGGKMNPELVAEFADYCRDQGKNFFVMYGQTEATARMTYLSDRDIGRKIGSVGVAIDGGRISVLNEEGNQLAPSLVPGEIVFEGPNVAMGYADHESDLLLGNLWNGRLVTGDIGYLDEEGFLYITGRSKRFVKIFGKRVNLDHLEEIINRSGFQAAITGSDDSLVLWTESEEDGMVVRDRLSQELLIHPSVFSIRQTEEIPRTPAGKVDYSKLIVSEND